MMILNFVFIVDKNKSRRHFKRKLDTSPETKSPFLKFWALRIIWDIYEDKVSVQVHARCTENEFHVLESYLTPLSG